MHNYKQSSEERTVNYTGQNRTINSGILIVESFSSFAKSNTRRVDHAHSITCRYLRGFYTGRV